MAAVGITTYTGYMYELSRFQIHLRTVLVAIGTPSGLPVLVRISFFQRPKNLRNAELRITRRSAYEQTVMVRATPKNTPTDVVLASSSLTCKLAAKVSGTKKKASSVNLQCTFQEASHKFRGHLLLLGQQYTEQTPGEILKSIENSPPRVNA
ncbi:MAG: hypothetical protein Q9173_003079 [Seirophora scorigena]